MDFSFMQNQQASILPKLTQPAKIGDALTCDVVISRETKFESGVTEYPVEDGFSVADHVIRKPMGLTLDVLFTPTPVTWFGSSFGATNSMNNVVNQIMDIYRKAEPITITLVDAIYTDMVMISAPLPRNVENGYCYKCQLSFKHVRRVVQRTEDVPQEYADNEAAGKAGATEKNGGAASQQDIGTGMVIVDPSTNNGKSQLPGMMTDSVDLSQYGSIGTGIEASAYIASSSLYKSFGGGVIVGDYLIHD